MKKGVGKSYTHHNCLSMEKYFLKHAIHVFFDKKNQKEALMGASGDKEGGGFGSLYSSTHSTVIGLYRTRINLT